MFDDSKNHMEHSSTQVMAIANLVDKVYWLLTSHHSANTATNNQVIDLHTLISHESLDVFLKMINNNTIMDEKVWHSICSNLYQY